MDLWRELKKRIATQNATESVSETRCFMTVRLNLGFGRAPNAWR